MSTKAVYDFLGYTLVEAKYINYYKKENTYISISLAKDNYNEEKRQYNIIVRIATDFDRVESQFKFQAAFLINDMNWFKSLEENDRKSIFFSAVFPFIREKVFTITSDTRSGLLIPVIDMRNVNFENELRFLKNAN